MSKKKYVPRIARMARINDFFLLPLCRGERETERVSQGGWGGLTSFQLQSRKQFPCTADSIVHIKAVNTLDSTYIAIAADINP